MAQELTLETRTGQIRQALLEEVAEHPRDLITHVAERFSVSRQAIHRQVRKLIAEGRLQARGTTRNREYVLPTWDAVVHLRTEGLEEDRVWTLHLEPLLTNVNRNAIDIWRYGFTEMVNNVIDHSESPLVTIAFRRHSDRPRDEVLIRDYGVGIFQKIQHARGLENPQQAIFELSKGKLTTDPERHTGEGIFFTSRMFDDFSISSAGLYLGSHRGLPDWLLVGRSNTDGTAVFLDLDPNTDHTVQEVFDRYASDQDDYAFSRTVVSLKLADSGRLVSRSQAKRVLSRLEQFKEVVLDFSGVDEIGAAFSDEIFRVYRRANPQVQLVPINYNKTIERMINRARHASMERETLLEGMRELFLSEQFKTANEMKRWEMFHAKMTELDPGRLQSLERLEPTQRQELLAVFDDLLDQSGSGTQHS